MLLVLGYRYPWLGITLLMLMAYVYRNEITNLGDRVLALLSPFRGYSAGAQAASYHADLDGHFRIDGRVNGIVCNFLVDTGATYPVLNQADARRLGFHPERLYFGITVSTANGLARTALVWLQKLEKGPIIQTNVPALLASDKLETPLLGMEFLRHLAVVEMKHGVLPIRR